MTGPGGELRWGGQGQGQGSRAAPIRPKMAPVIMVSENGIIRCPLISQPDAASRNDNNMA